MKLHIILIALSCLAVIGCGKKRFSMPAASMEPTIPKGSEVIADMRAYQSESPSRFDLVIFHPPEEVTNMYVKTRNELVFCMRIIGLPDEKIEIREDEIFIDSVKLTTPEGLNYRANKEKDEPVILGSDEYFLLGDNTGNAYDSRYWGPIKRGYITGKVTNIQPVGVDNPSNAQE